jgi:hypothetical protein
MNTHSFNHKTASDRGVFSWRVALCGLCCAGAFLSCNFAGTLPLQFPVDASNDLGDVRDAGCDGAVCDAGCVDTRSNVQHCGGCGVSCAQLHATTACENSVCVRRSCEPGWGDCDGIASNGCETNTSNAMDHCGGCGVRCAPYASQSAMCVAGSCVRTCVAGRGNCDGEEADGGCEVDLTANTQHCGACGAVCGTSGVVPGGATCGDGGCMLQCVRSRGDCDSNASNGCERIVSNDNNNCGGCGAVCETGGGLRRCYDNGCCLDQVARACDPDASVGCCADRFACRNTTGLGFACCVLPGRSCTVTADCCEGSCVPGDGGSTCL